MAVSKDQNGIERQGADETLPDCRSFRLTAEQWEVFQTALNAEARILPRMAKGMEPLGRLR